MFTGIITTLGKVVSLTPVEEGKVFTIAYLQPSASSLTAKPPPHTKYTEHTEEASLHNKTTKLTPSLPPASIAPLKLGASLAVNGVCTTLTAISPQTFTFFASKETLAITNLRSLTVKALVNVESALRYGDKVDGHLVYGHVDTTLPLITAKKAGGSWQFHFAIKPKHRRYIIHKGAIALNGISLTVYNLTATTLEVMIIPHTYAHTNLKTLQPGNHINVEFDTIPKYLENLLRSSHIIPPLG